MTKILVLYYSSYGHVETLANAIAEGARSVEGTEVTVKRVPETMSPEAAAKAGVKLDQAAPVADPKEIGEYDAILFGTPTRFGNMAAQMRNFLDQTGRMWLEGKLIGKVGSVFASTASRERSEPPVDTTSSTTQTLFPFSLAASISSMTMICFSFVVIDLTSEVIGFSMYPFTDFLATT